GVFAIVGSLSLALIHDATIDRIRANERATILRTLHILIPPERHDNDLFSDVIRVRDPLLQVDNEPVEIYRARRQGQPVAAILTAVAPEGYNGNIYLLVAVNYDGTLAGVGVTRHLETPGLGDGIDRRKSDWIHIFDGKSLNDPVPEQWGVRKDGGAFDQLTGATISPRAVVKAVYNALVYYKEHRDDIFAQPAEPATDE
ncbi:MAG TPA: electron transport complex subunit RsxG, partial [Gammaproteobacteria bacterium]|nr:electron transport complex subunit RsxG [Gammaproteobacteria bacterium]